jgi:hypothetical protein
LVLEALAGLEDRAELKLDVASAFLREKGEGKRENGLGGRPSTEVVCLPLKPEATF